MFLCPEQISIFLTQINKADYEKHSHSSKMFAALDKNKDGCVSAHEMESKAEKAFRVSGVTEDGKYSTKVLLNLAASRKYGKFKEKILADIDIAVIVYRLWTKIKMAS